MAFVGGGGGTGTEQTVSWGEELKKTEMCGWKKSKPRETQLLFLDRKEAK